MWHYFQDHIDGYVNRVYGFCSQTNCADGGWPHGGLIQASDGNLYGTTANGGNSCPDYGEGETCGTVFKVDGNGSLTTLYRFCAETHCTEGAFPQGNLVQGTDGSFYGTTYWGGAQNGGTVFKLTSAGELTTLYSFCSQTNCADGKYP